MSNMVDYEKHFRVYCEENSLTINLSFDMPEHFTLIYAAENWPLA